MQIVFEEVPFDAIREALISELAETPVVRLETSAGGFEPREARRRGQPAGLRVHDLQFGAAGDRVDIEIPTPSGLVELVGPATAEELILEPDCVSWWGEMEVGANSVECHVRFYCSLSQDQLQSLARWFRDYAPEEGEASLAAQ